MSKCTNPACYRNPYHQGVGQSPDHTAELTGWSFWHPVVFVFWASILTVIGTIAAVIYEVIK